MSRPLTALVRDIGVCRRCLENPDGVPLPHAPRPVLRVSDKARIAICGQAPGTRVHESGIPFADPSGDRLREWMAVTENEFYDKKRISIIPMGFCFPGLNSKGGDLPPRLECSRLWHTRLLALMPKLDLILLVGVYAQKYHLGKAAKPSLTETVRNWREYLGETRLDGVEGRKYLPLPHPSWRNNAWIKKNAWFSSEVLPRLRQEIRDHM